MARHPVTLDVDVQEHKARTPAQLKALAKARKVLAIKQARTARMFTRRGLASYQAIAHPDSAVGKLLASYRDALITDAGGEDQLSAAKSMLIETAAVSLLIVRCLDGSILRALVTSGEAGELPDTSLPILAERRATADSLRGSLKLLGLSRVARKVDGEWWTELGITDEEEKREEETTEADADDNVIE